MTVGSVLLQPSSTDAARLASSDPTDKPLIDPGFLTDQSDLDGLVEAVRLTQR